MKQKLELFSPLNEGQLVNETTYLKQMLTFAQQEWKGITMTDALVKKVWDKVKKNQYLEDNVADEVAEMYEKMAFDYETAVDLIESKNTETIVNDNVEVVEPVEPEHEVFAVPPALPKTTAHGCTGNDRRRGDSRRTSTGSGF